MTADPPKATDIGRPTAADHAAALAHFQAYLALSDGAHMVLSSMVMRHRIGLPVTGALPPVSLRCKRCNGSSSVDRISAITGDFVEHQCPVCDNGVVTHG